MVIWKKFVRGIGILVVMLLALVFVNILQNGTGGWDGRSIEKILGVPPQQATVADIEKLSKFDVMQPSTLSSARVHQR